MGVSDRNVNGSEMGRVVFKGSAAVSEEIQADGERYRELKNGAVYDMESKRIVANPGGGTTAITQANASEIGNIYREQRAAAAREEIADRKGKGDLIVGIRALTGNQIDLASDIERGRASTEAYKTVMMAAGMWDRPGQSANNLANSTQVSLPNEIAHRILDILQDKRSISDE